MKSGMVNRAVSTQISLVALEAYIASTAEINALLPDRESALESALEGFFAGVNPANVVSVAREYVDRVWPHALEAAKALGVPPHFLVAHSALESAWGENEIRRKDGSPSYNVFGIKAQGGWKGDCVEVTTTGYVDGLAQTRREKFRAYGSYGEAFQDYVRLLRGSARYSEVMDAQEAFYPCDLEVLAA